MKKLLIALTLFASVSYAGNGGSVSCNDGEEVVALYTWFHSSADSYSSVQILMFNNDDGKYHQFSGNNEEALKPIIVKTFRGTRVEVSPNLQNSTCKINVWRDR